MSEIDRWLAEAKRFYRANQDTLMRAALIGIAVALLVNLVAMLWPLIPGFVLVFGSMASWEYVKWKRGK